MKIILLLLIITYLESVVDYYIVYCIVNEKNVFFVPVKPI